LRSYPRLLIVTPSKNENHNIRRMMEMLENQTLVNFCWVLVIDGCEDDSLQIASKLSPSFPFHFIEYNSSGLLIKGGAFQTWNHGVEYGLTKFPDADFVMKLDADVELTKDYFLKLFSDTSELPDVLGGVISGSSREQNEHVPGPVKMYSRKAFLLIQELPLATGLDVMDEVICRSRGLTIAVKREAKFRMTRNIGHSQGKLHGRFRNGLVCRWTGYSFVYFLLHVVRYFFRDPYIFGSIWMLFGYFTAGEGPYDAKLKQLHTRIQRKKLLRLVRSPWKTLRNLYF
jgi:dolichol-phosphate mannosyltransferase